MDIVKVIVKRLKSYFKSDWNFEDYPISIGKNPYSKESKLAYGAGIINWTMMFAHGGTREEALKALKDKFKLYKESNDHIPRPGTKVPLKFASTEQIDKYEKTAVDFFQRVLKANYYEGFYSDGSILAYSEPPDEEEAEEMREEIIRRTLLLYNVDISDIYDEPLWKIFERIENRK